MEFGIQTVGVIIAVVGLLIGVCGPLIGYIFKRHVKLCDERNDQNREDHKEIRGMINGKEKEKEKG